MEPVMACRICLNTDIKLYDMSRYCLKSAYESLCGNNVQTPHLDAMLQHICMYCAMLLNKFTLFKERCQQANHLMGIMLSESLQLTTEHIKNINKLKTNIALPYTTQVLYNLDSTTEIKDEYHYNKLGNINDIEDILDCVSPGSVKADCDGLQTDSDDEPLSKKIRKRKKKISGPKKGLGKEKHESIEPKLEIEPFEENETENWEKDFELVLLTKEQQIEEILARKNSANYQNSMYKCEYCYKGFMTEVTYKNHMILRHDVRAGALACGVCGARCACPRALRAHAALHARRYVCRVCAHAVCSRHKARQHYNWHRGYLFVCKLCGVSFSKSTTHLTHMRLRHPSTAACDTCGDRFLNQTGLNMHKKKVHRLQEIEMSIEYLECNTCGSRFRNEDALKRHHDLADNSICDTKLRPCERCGDSFHDEESYNEHLEMHRRLSALRKCGECARTFASERALALHRARAHAPEGGRGGRPARVQRAVCEVCGHTCISRASLVYHQRIHSGEKPYECSLCPKRFSVFQRLQIHIRTHTDERPFKCPHCPKAFKHKAALNRHDRVHSGARPYRCATCGKAFSQSNSMKQHAASVHLRAPLYARKPARARALPPAF